MSVVGRSFFVDPRRASKHELRTRSQNYLSPETDFFRNLDANVPDQESGYKKMHSTVIASAISNEPQRNLMASSCVMVYEIDNNARTWGK